MRSGGRYQICCMQFCKENLRFDLPPFMSFSSTGVGPAGLGFPFQNHSPQSDTPNKYLPLLLPNSSFHFLNNQRIYNHLHLIANGVKMVTMQQHRSPHQQKSSSQSRGRIATTSAESKIVRFMINDKFNFITLLPAPSPSHLLPKPQNWVAISVFETVYARFNRDSVTSQAPCAPSLHFYCFTLGRTGSDRREMGELLLCARAPPIYCWLLVSSICLHPVGW